MRTRSQLSFSNASAKVLIAEDHPDSREALHALLDAVGFEVMLAMNGREAVDLAREHRPDLILMDMMMPKLDGFAATRMLRRDARTAAIPIIVVTAMEGADRLAAQAGADEFVCKPIETSTLLRKMRRLLGEDEGLRRVAAESRRGRRGAAEAGRTGRRVEGS